MDDKLLPEDKNIESIDSSRNFSFSRKRNGFFFWLCIVTIAIILIGVFFICFTMGFSKNKREEQISITFSKVEKKTNLAVLECETTYVGVSKIDRFTNVVQFYGNARFTTNLSKAHFIVNEVENSIEVILQPVELLSENFTIDNQKTKILFSDGGPWYLGFSNGNDLSGIKGFKELKATAYSELEMSFKTDSFYHELATSSAVNRVEELLYQLNKGNKNLKINVHF